MGGLNNEKSLNANLNFFSNFGNLKRMDNKQLFVTFEQCLKEDQLLALKMIFYFRSVRKIGLGDRPLPAKLLRYLANNYTYIVIKNLPLIPYYGRFDDLYALDGTKVEKEMYFFLYTKAMEDLQNDKPSLLGKWLISANTKSRKMFLGIKTAKYFAYFKTNDKKCLGVLKRHQLNPILKEYRQLLTTLRKKINVLETHLCQKEYDCINFNNLTNIAKNRYANTFKRIMGNDYLKLLKEEMPKTLTTYDLVKSFCKDTPLITEQRYQMLPYYKGNGDNLVVIKDVNGSADINPALSLAIYLADHNQGFYYHKVLTYKNNKLCFLSFNDGDSFLNKYTSLPNVKKSLNINSVLKFILNNAIENNLKNDELPKRILFLFETRFADCFIKEENYDQHLRTMFENYQYTLPEIVFWNTATHCHEGRLQVKQEAKGITLIRGINATIFESIMKSADVTPLNYMNEVLNNPYFDLVQI